MPTSSQLALPSSPSTCGRLEAHNLAKLILRFVRLAFAFESVRFAILGISAEHLALVQRSAIWAEIGNWYRARSFAHLRDAIRDFSQKNCDAVLVSSIVLCWQARDG